MCLSDNSSDMTWYYKIHKSEKDDQFYFNLYAGNGQVILSSQWYTTKQSAHVGIDSIRHNGGAKKNYVCMEAKDGRMFFDLKATNGEIIGKSQMYKTMDGCMTGVLSVMENSASLGVVE